MRIDEAVQIEGVASPDQAEEESTITVRNALAIFFILTGLIAAAVGFGAWFGWQASVAWCGMVVLGLGTLLAISEG